MYEMHSFQELKDVTIAIVRERSSEWIGQNRTPREDDSGRLLVRKILNNRGGVIRYGLDGIETPVDGELLVIYKLQDEELAASSAAGESDI